VIPDVEIIAYVVEIGGDAINRDNFEVAQIDKNPFFCPDEAAAGRLGKAGGRGAQGRVFARRGDRMCRDRRSGRLGRAALCQARQRTGRRDDEHQCRQRASKSARALKRHGCAGEENADRMRPSAGSNQPEFLANNAGGIAGGISTGQPVVVRVAFKPTSSILTPVETVTREGEATDIVTKGRHDPCVGIRGAPVVEAMMALVLADQKLLHRAQCG
jgi:chorismate synthase